MSHISENNKRISKNVFYLYIRMVVLMFIGLFTSRIILNTLGVSDFGLYNVVGGVVAIMGFFNSLLSQASSRFLTFALGKENLTSQKETFSTCVTIHVLLSIILIILGETIGVWIVNNKLTIPEERIEVANFVYQISLFTAAISITQAPYSASVVAHEKMSAFAYMTIVDTLLRFGVVYILLIGTIDKLKLFALLNMGVTIVGILVYHIYCKKKFEECHFKLSFNKSLYKEMFGYVGWNVIGAAAFLLNGQGITLLLNVFFGTIVNAAQGIAMQVSSKINQFIANFQLAVNPQVIKYHAQGLHSEMNQLIMNNAKYSSFLIYLLGIPTFLEIHFLLDIWLGQVPPYTVIFSRIIIIQLLIQAFDFPIGQGIHAFGKMKLPNLTSSIVYLSILPISYLFLKAGASAETVYIIIVCAYPVALICDVIILHKYSNFPIYSFFIQIIGKSLLILFSCIPLPLIIYLYFNEGWARFLVVLISSLLCSSTIIYYGGLPIHIREKVLIKIKSKLKF